ncbi:cytochrome b6 [Vulcanimicrobium alpinum]|uniref:Cytochrome b6 n=1 Tax=Vulcanimicrobium alpinum TaxID=3016050 RepID=A0AAN1XSQ4_UNVUL|nr:cytochrome c oxidase subunit 3 [Vulcanimicrobium alpinum]BDE05105.1 cytochrome b6 [Vulcanimicrobium alpinum]
MAVSIAKQGYNLGHGEHGDHEHELVIYQETRDMRLLGFVLFLGSDVVLFSAFIFAYIYLRTTVSPTWPPILDGHQLPRLDTAFAAVNSVVLFGSGVTMHYALENWKHGNRPRYNLFMLLTILLGAGFLGGQAYEYAHAQIGGWSGSIFGASFFTLTGMHGFHVFVGVVYLIVLWLQTQRNVYDQERYFGLTAGTLYWHFVDVIWVALFFLFYLW